MRRMTTLVAVTLLAAGAAVASDYTEIFDQTYPLDGSGRVGLENVNGDAVVEVWDRPEVRVYAIKRASSPERLAGLRIEVDSSAQQLDVETHYPSSRELGEADRHGHMEVEYTLTIPRTAALGGVDLVNGDLLVTGVEGGIEADTVNGTIVVRGAGGELELETVNGSIELDLPSVGVDRAELSSVNGTVEVMVLGSAEIRAETVNGRISNDVGLEVRKGKYVGASMVGSIGGGGPRIEIETVNGGITVRSGS